MTFRVPILSTSHCTSIRRLTQNRTTSEIGVEQPVKEIEVEKLTEEMKHASADDKESPRKSSRGLTIQRRNELLSQAFQTERKYQPKSKFTAKDYDLTRFQRREVFRRLRKGLNEQRAGKAAEYPYECAHCSFRVKSKAQLNEHIRIIHDDAVLYLCTGCGLGFSKTKNAKQHRDKRFTLPECKTGRLVFAPKDQIKANWICSACEVSFDLEDEYDRHRRESMSPGCKDGRCLHIPSFKERSALYAKFRERMKDYTTCPECSAVFLQRTSLLVHERQHHIGERRICTGCKQVFSGTLKCSPAVHWKKMPGCAGKPTFHLPPPGRHDQILCLCCAKLFESTTAFEAHKGPSERCQDADHYLVAANPGAEEHSDAASSP
ncbi:hypothetical protein BT69DRAFT_1279014 [Atractiella rhizophila]|nr:hypothetical protein BT69DRAFT_1279014 [Atractiella rhizophila]